MLKRIICFGVMLVMVFSLAACGDKDFVEVETDDLIELQLMPTSVDISLIMILLKHTDENAVFECIVDKGNFFLLNGENTNKKINLLSGDKINWRPMEMDIDGKIVSIQIEQAFVDIIIKIDGNITGYAVIEFLQVNKPFHTGSILKSVIFPKVEGEYQSVTENQIKLIIEKIKGGASL